MFGSRSLKRLLTLAALGLFLAPLAGCVIAINTPDRAQKGKMGQMMERCPHCGKLLSDPPAGESHEGHEHTNP